MKLSAPAVGSIAVAVLAGGAGTRFGGVDKGLVELHGGPLIAWLIDSIPVELRGRLLIVANRNIERYAHYAPTIGDARSGHAGPLAGIAVALQACRSPWLFTAPVDCVKLPCGLLDRLWQDASHHGNNAVVAHDGIRRQPLFALYRSRLAQSAASALERDAGVSRWQDSIEARDVDVSALAEAWININTPADLADFAKHGSRHG